jgi:hypothetical protein
MYKRRVIYLSDEQWQTLLAASKDRHESVSAIIRESIAVLLERTTRCSFDPDLTAQRVQVMSAARALSADPPKPPTPSNVIGSMTQAQRDAVLRKMGKEK